MIFAIHVSDPGEPPGALGFPGGAWYWRFSWLARGWNFETRSDTREHSDSCITLWEPLGFGCKLRAVTDNDHFAMALTLECTQEIQVECSRGCSTGETSEFVGNGLSNVGGDTGFNFHTPVEVCNSLSLRCIVCLPFARVTRASIQVVPNLSLREIIYSSCVPVSFVMHSFCVPVDCVDADFDCRTHTQDHPDLSTRLTFAPAGRTLVQICINPTLQDAIRLLHVPDVCIGDVPNGHTVIQVHIRLPSRDGMHLFCVIASYSSTSDSSTCRSVHSGPEAASHEEAAQSSALDFTAADVHVCTRSYVRSRMHTHTHARTHVLALPLPLLLSLLPPASCLSVAAPPSRLRCGLPVTFVQCLMHGYFSSLPGWLRGGYCSACCFACALARAVRVQFRCPLGCDSFLPVRLAVRLSLCLSVSLSLSLSVCLLVLLPVRLFPSSRASLASLPLLLCWLKKRLDVCGKKTDIVTLACYCRTLLLLMAGNIPIHPWSYDHGPGRARRIGSDVGHASWKESKKGRALTGPSLPLIR